MLKTEKKFDLEDRTLIFAKQIINFCKNLTNNTINFKLIDQLIRSAGSIGANYREANDSLGKKDFIHRLRIARKESKETNYWLRVIADTNPSFRPRMKDLMQEGKEIVMIVSAIILSTKSKKKI